VTSSPPRTAAGGTGGPRLRRSTRDPPDFEGLESWIIPQGFGSPPLGDLGPPDVEMVSFQFFPFLRGKEGHRDPSPRAGGQWDSTLSFLQSNSWMKGISTKVLLTFLREKGVSARKEGKTGRSCGDQKVGGSLTASSTLPGHLRKGTLL